ncbi:MAG: hypothetical protein HC852_11210 [Acaryochloridaceae cyanobacterium RU_4_10]|nr:hypothetical protein [Acaryochloridaceae cyanobacterium RU_4_10]
MTQFSDDWLQHKPKFRLHQRVQSTPGVLGRVSGLQQMESGQWRYQILTPAQYGVTLSWWDESQLRELDDLFMISSIECGMETITRGRGTLEDAIADVRYFAEEAHRLFEEEGRKIAVQFRCCRISEPEIEEELITDDDCVNPNFEPLRTCSQSL